MDNLPGKENMIIPIINPARNSLKQKGSRMVKVRRKSHRRTRRNARSSVKIHRPVIVESGGLFYRPKFKHGKKKGTVSSKLFRKATRLNPRHRRRSRRLFRNPSLNLKSTFKVSNLLFLASIGSGVALGFLGIPLIDRFMPQAIKDQRKWAYGVLYILLGSVMASMVKGKNLKTAAMTFAGMGIYDLISQYALTDLPQISTVNPIITNLIPDSSSTVAADYLAYPGTSQLAANYETMGADSCDPYAGILM